MSEVNPLIKKNVWEIVRNIRHEMLLNQVEFWEKVWIDQGTISNIENWQIPRNKTLRRLAEWLELPLSTFINIWTK